MLPPSALFVVSLSDGKLDENITAQAFQITADGSLCFGNITVEPGQNPQIDVTRIFNSRVWDQMRKSSLQPATGMRTQ